MPSPTRRPKNVPAFEPRLRRGAVRVSVDVAIRLRAGHPYVFREALGARALPNQTGEMIDVLDPSGAFIAKGLYDADNVVAIRIFSRDVGEMIDVASLRRRVEAARKLRVDFFDERTTAYRIIHSEGDGVPGITVDRYGDYFVSHLFTAAAQPLIAPLYDALEEIYQPKAIYQQDRLRPLAGEGPRGPATLQRGSLAPVEIEVLESGLKFAVDVTAPMGTGLFLDLRQGRRVVAAHARGRRVLNLFSYTGAFSIYAAQAGAKEVVSVDLASRVHGRARHNLTLNGLSETGHEFIAGDAFKVLAKMGERGRKFDLIVIDPPSFSQAKGRVFSIAKDFSELVQGALGVAAPGAYLACVSNTHKLSIEELDRAIGEGAGRAGRYVRVIDRCGLPPDFPVPAGFAEGHYLKFIFCAAA